MQWLKNTVSAVLLGSLSVLSIGALADDGLQAYQAFPFEFAPEQGKTIKVAFQGAQLNATLPNQKKQTLAATADIKDAMGTDAQQFAVAQVGDFNFDGALDVAILSGNGYGGVNLFYDVFLWNKAKQNLQALKIPMSNPSLAVKRREVTSSERSGPKWYATTYRVSKGTLYPAAEWQMVGTDGAFGFYTFKNPAGKVIGHKVVGDESSTQAAEKQADATAKIAAEKATLYDQPKASAKTKMYVVKGDSVTLLDWRADEQGDFGAGWFLARYTGKKTLEKWIKGDVLEVSH